MNRGHVVISGTGRAGTSFLVQLLTNLGLETGFGANTELPLDPRGGLDSLDIFESDNLHRPDLPYIIKSPFLCDLLDATVAEGLQIEHAIVPLRNLDAAATSRAYVQRLTTGQQDGADRVPGGLWDTDNADDQATVLRFKLTRLLEALVHYDIPTTFLWYPRLARDPDYLHKKLRFLLGDIDLASFRAEFSRLVRPDWIHQFTEDDR